MVKASLGKGMKDLLSKNFGLADQGSKESKESAEDELKTSINRYQAQDFDVSILKELQGKGAKKISKGIEDYRKAVKKLLAAKTVIKSLEPYGYTEELENITKDIKNPGKADSVVKKVDKLKERMLSEHNVKTPKKTTPKVKLPQELEKKAERLADKSTDEKPEEDAEDMDIDPDELDNLMKDLNDIGDAFDLQEEELVDDPELVGKISEWESQGLFVDKLKKLVRENIDQARAEAESFEKDLKDLMVQKERYDQMDLSKFKRQKEELGIKFQYPNMASEIKNELDLMEKYLKEIEQEKEAEKEVQEAPDEDIHQELPKPDAEESAGKGPSEEKDASVPSENEKGSDQGDDPKPAQAEPQETEAAEPEPEKIETPADEPEEAEPVEEEPEEAEPVEEELQEAEPVEEERFSGLSVDEIMEKAKEAYRNGDTEASLEFFEEILKRDPDNSKARFMKRRLSSKT